MSYSYDRRTARSADQLLETVETSAHKAKEMLANIERLHKEWDHTMATGKFEDAHRAFMKLDVQLKAYQKELIAAMGSLEMYEEETGRNESQEYPEKF